MPTIIEANVQTGEVIEREMTAEEIATLPTPEPEVPSAPVVDLYSLIQELSAKVEAQAAEIAILKGAA